ncbi:MAG: tripartite tricarboxylate transporter substrate-binding protein [Deltaproteobacteria bacterium]|nr:tripartite tricarboxylate transporter substrate-binding protein [Deltaproteobacteria bacterium]
MTRTSFLTRFAVAFATAVVLALSASNPALAAEKLIDKVHFLIPGGAGGGWDGTARGTGEALTKSGIVGSASYENMSGGGGGKAIGFLIENAASNHGTLMVNSTPIIIRSLTKRFPHNFRDLTMIAGTIGDYQAIITGKDSPYKNFSDVVAAYKKDPRKVSVGGGSVPGSLDHLSIAMAFQAAGADPTKVKYIAYDAGGKLNAAILSGEVAAGSTGFSEAVGLAKAGEMRILAVTSPERVPAFKDAPTLKEQGYDVTFVNWRGFFAAPGLPEDKANLYRKALAAMYPTPEWKAVRDRNGWVDIHNSGKDFVDFLENQEKVIKTLMQQLGFLK